MLDNAYKVHMKLTIRSVSAQDYGSYKCVAKNSLGETDGSIKLYRKYFLNLLYNKICKKKINKIIGAYAIIFRRNTKNNNSYLLFYI